MLFSNACPSPVSAPTQSSPVAVPRRSFLGTAALSIGGLIFVPRASGAALVDTSALPKAWVDQQGSNLAAYADFLNGLKLKRVSVSQVIAAHAKCRTGTWNQLPPKSTWKNMEPTLKALDMIGAELGKPVSQITSAYRSPSYNAKCAGAKKGSWHQKNYALDVKFDVSASTVASAAKRLRSKGKFTGGVGRYPTFTHIDTRGVNATW